jgi:hypothetical protein
MKSIEMFHVKQDNSGNFYVFPFKKTLEYYSKGEILCYLILMPT